MDRTWECIVGFAYPADPERRVAVATFDGVYISQKRSADRNLEKDEQGNILSQEKIYLTVEAASEEDAKSKAKEKAEEILADIQNELSDAYQELREKPGLQTVITVQEAADQTTEE